MKRFAIGLAAIVMIAAVAFGIAYLMEGSSVVNVGASLNSNDKVVIQIDKTNGQRLTYVVHPNTMTIEGESMVENILSTGSAAAYGAVKYISLSDATQTGDNTPAVLATEINANGLSRATGTVTAPSGTTWNIYTVSNKFTCTTGSQSCKVAGLNWSATPASTGNLWAYATFTEVALNVGDNITVTWTVTFTAGG